MSAEVEEFLAELRPDVKGMALHLRAFILAALPEADERVDFGNRLLIFQLSGAETSQPVCELRPCRGYIELRFWQGAKLQDPGRLLAGTGAGLRHVRLETHEQAASPAVGALIEQAAELGRSLVSA